MYSANRPAASGRLVVETIPLGPRLPWPPLPGHIYVEDAEAWAARQEEHPIRRWPRDPHG